MSKIDSQRIPARFVYKQHRPGEKTLWEKSPTFTTLTKTELNDMTPLSDTIDGYEVYEFPNGTEYLMVLQATNKQ